jgi:outer membrane lipoprotein-sorting protein
MASDDPTKLLERARDSFRTIDIAWTFACDPVLLSRAAFAGDPGKPSDGALSSDAPSKQRGSREHRNHATTHSERVRVWWRRPGSWRDESAIDSATRNIRVIQDGIFTTYVGALNTVFTNREPRKSPTQPGLAIQADSIETLLPAFPVIEPSILKAHCDLTVIGTATYLERDALRVAAVCNSAAPRTPFLWEGVTTYELAVDRERGILLRYAALVDNKEVATISVESVVLDQAIPDSAFEFDIPAGSEIVSI